MTKRQKKIVDTDRQDRENITEDAIIHLEAPCGTSVDPSSSSCSAIPSLLSLVQFSIFYLLC